ncbi:MAG: serine hydrolase domain-containing protein [Dermatophilaceae bacterium]
MSRGPLVLPALDRLVDDRVLPGYSVAVRRADDVHVAVRGVADPRSGVPVTEATSYRLGSLSKPVAGLLTIALVADGVLDLDADITTWCPELAGLRVLREPSAAIDDTVPLDRPMTVRHLLTMTSGFGMGGTETAVAEAMASAGIGPGPVPPRVTAAQLLGRLAGIPLGFAPGEGWAYHTSTDVLSVLLARATGTGLEALLRRRLTGPLAAGAVSFAAPPPVLRAPALWPRPAGFEPVEPGGPAADELTTFSSGLWATAPDLLRVLDEFARPSVVPADAVAHAVAPALTDRQHHAAAGFLGPHQSFGLHVSVTTADDPVGPRAGSVGWAGGVGTLGHVDSASDLTGALLTNRMVDGPDGSPAFAAFVADLYSSG